MTTEEIGTATGTKVNRLAVVSVVAGLVSVASMFGFGIPTLAVFAVGPGHVALRQIRDRHERGTGLAWAGLLFGYGVGVGALLLVVRLLPQVPGVFTA